MERVVFRAWKSNGNVIAFFLDQPETPALSYEHIGQHGAPYHSQTRAGTKEEYMPLFCELQRIGYTMRVVTKGQNQAQRIGRANHRRNIRATS